METIDIVIPFVAKEQLKDTVYSGRLYGIDVIAKATFEDTTVIESFVYSPAYPYLYNLGRVPAIYPMLSDYTSSPYNFGVEAKAISPVKIFTNSENDRQTALYLTSRRENKVREKMPDNDQILGDAASDINIIMGEVKGQVLADISLVGRLANTSQLLREICEFGSDFHDTGFVHIDPAAVNLILTPDQKLTAIDPEAIVIKLI